MSRWERGEYFINKKDEHDLKQLLINEDYRKSFEVDSSTEDDRDKYLGNVFTTLEEIGKLQSTKEINPEEIFA